MPIINQITAWSYSRWRDYVQCPLRAKFKHVDKIKEPGSDAMDRGTEIHKLAEDFAGGKLKALPEELKKFKKQFLAIKKYKPKLEEEWAFNKDWKRVDWFAKDAWWRVKMDAAYLVNSKEYQVMAVVVDHKTGKYRAGEYIEQLEGYALAAFLVYPQAEAVECYLWFLDSGEQECYKASRTELEKLKTLWLGRIKPMMADKRFAPKPGNYCRWCPHSKSKGGKCKF